MRNLAIALTLVLMACGNGERPGSVPAAKANDKPTLRLAIVTDLQGQLEPCGCQSRPLGGIDRMATALQRLRGDGVPTVVLASGDLLFGAEAAHGHASGPEAAQQDRWRAETLIEILNRLGLAAVNPGGADWKQDASAIRQLLGGLRTQPLSTGPQATPKARSHVITEGGLRVGLIGIEGDTPIDAEVSALRSAGVAVVVVLVSGERRAATRAARTSGVDFVVSGGIDIKQPSPPAEAGQAHVLTAGRQGEGLLVVDVYRSDGGGRYVDASPWSRARQEQARASSIADLKARIAAWEQQPGIDQAALGEQRRRLAALEQQARATASAPIGNRFVAVWQEIDPETPRDPTVEALIDAYDSRVNQHNRVALAGLKAPTPTAGQPHYVGSSQCQSCHQKAFAWWTGHPHGNAYATLQEVNKEFNLSCVGCHVTGYNRPGGSTVVQNEGLTNVGCESCHGPGSAHVADPDEEPYSVQRVVAESVCVACHNPDHSDKFDYATYREKLLVPGHGKPFVAPPTAP